jgi:hypothetical protein
VSLAEDDAAGQAKRVAEGLLAGASDIALSHHDTNVAATDAEMAADQVGELWINAPKFLILACVYLVAALDAFEDQPAKLEAFLTRLVVRHVLSENDVLGRLKANGKLAMLRKIGQHADTLLQASLLHLLPGHYSIIYQICLLIEEAGPDRAQSELSTRPDATRDDVIKVRAALKVDEREPIPSQPPSDDVAVQLFAIRLTAQDLRPFADEHAQPDTLDRCFRRPPSADEAGLVAIVPIRMLGTFERALMPLLGFGAPDKLFLERRVDQPDITDRDVIVVATRGKLPAQLLTGFPADLGCHDLPILAEAFFPDSTVRCHLFAQARTAGWLTYIGDENWNERPSLR